MHSKLVVYLVIATFLLSLTGCAAKQAVPEFNAQYYPQCYDPIARLCKDQDNSQEIKETALGALGGAAAGAILGGLASGDWKGAAIGATAGAVAGGLTGFFHARLSKINDRKERLAEYQKILGENAKDWSLERSSVESAYKCYRDQLVMLQKQAKDKKITRDEFLARTNEIKEGIEHINTYWADSQTRMDARLADGEAFLKQQEEEDRKLAAAQQRQAKKDIERLRGATASQKSRTQQEYARVNLVKNEAQAELLKAQMYLEEDSTLACNEQERYRA